MTAIQESLQCPPKGKNIEQEIADKMKTLLSKSRSKAKLSPSKNQGTQTDNG